MIQMQSRAARTSARGFTLIEVLIAIALVAILGAVVVPYFTGYLQRGKITAAKSSLSSINMSIESFHTDTNQYPEMLKDLVRAPVNEELAGKWVGPYIKNEKQLVDPWGQKFQYQVTPDQENPYELFSYGPKGKGAPKAERLSVWNL